MAPPPKPPLPPTPPLAPLPTTGTGATTEKKDTKKKTPNNVVSIGPALLENSKTFDPLRSAKWHDYYWNYVDQYFQPINVEDVKGFRSLPPSTNKKDDTSTTTFSITQRLIASLLDDGSATPPNSNIPPVTAITAAASAAVTVGSMKERLKQQNAMETRVRQELANVGLLDNSTETEIERATRTSVWRYREVKAGNSARQRSLARLVTVNELRDQSARRERKRANDNSEIAYLKLRLGLLKKSRKNRANVLEILSHKFGRYDHVDVSSANKSKKRKSGGGSRKGESTKKKTESSILMRGYSK